MHKRQTISTLLIGAVNLPMVIFLAFLLPWDYHREIHSAIAQKQKSLEEEAMTIYLGLSLLPREHQQESVQRYLNAVCMRMHDTRIPDQHIVAHWHGQLLFSRGHRGSSQEIRESMFQADGHPVKRGIFNSHELVAGRFGDNDVEVYVSESTTNMLASIKHEILLHLVMLTALAMAAAAIVNVVLWRMVARPVQQLSHRVTRIGQGEYNVGATRFASREMNELSAVIRRMATSLNRNHQEYKAQMMRAQQIQEHLLPHGVAIPGLALAYLFEPAEGVAGDYYDVIPLNDGSCLICIADVAGHGIAAAMGSGMLKAIVMHATERHRQPHEILSFVNQRLPVILPDEMITMFLGRWHSDIQQLDYASAGHEPGHFVSVGAKSHPLHATGVPLGIEQGGTWETESLRLCYGEQIILTTDGVVEASNPDGELFGRAKLAKIIGKYSSCPPTQFVEVLRQEINVHQGSEKQLDDITILVIEATDDCHVPNEDRFQNRVRNCSANFKHLAMEVRTNG